MDLVDMRFILAFALLSPTWLLAQVPFDVHSCVNLIEFREAHEMVSLGIEGLEEEWSWLAIGGSDEAGQCCGGECLDSHLRGR